MKPVLFLLNDRWSVARKGTTSHLMLASHQRGHSVLVTDVVHLQAVSATELMVTVTIECGHRQTCGTISVTEIAGLTY